MFYLKLLKFFPQMNKCVARQYSCKHDGSKSCIELERLHTDKTRGNEDSHIIIKYKDFDTMEKWWKLITKEIAGVKIAADIFENPKLF